MKSSERQDASRCNPLGPSDYFPWLRKWAFIRLKGTAFGNVPLNVELKLEVWDSPTKPPPDQYPDDVAKRMVEEFTAKAPSKSRNST